MEIKRSPNLILYFFGQLAGIDIDTFIYHLKKINENYSPDKLDLDLMNQILINSRIAKTKFELFKISVFSTFLGIGILGIGALIKN